MATVSLQSVQDLRAWVDRKLKEWPAGSVILLSGDLGAGKTELVRQVVRTKLQAQGLPEGRVVSPTFVIHQSYPKVGVEHFDLYRFEGAGREALVEIGYYDALSRVRAEGGLAFVEWPEKVADPKDLDADRRISISLQTDSSRIITDTP
ncbi:MAG: tRNA (adenosine(37)-N6)-threonylcarbamoyltransferase complex ATPase subunit type 1 TsaE [Deltaproteobacteria bacterium]|nr:tRNA (adenosine(37)-N6)-threonylcarbamoyltransferase complex ATPase subunit type 1 TsaE [Deltaproteobacteria bacterium]MBI3294486.1 tRNA (adenosine(37)-N6)-threonylcarbamoyltransferase complex ATPase subunit type 1 TsaE [Deltaproteobacteria bacterium]